MRKFENILRLFNDQLSCKVLGSLAIQEIGRCDGTGFQHGTLEWVLV